MRATADARHVADDDPFTDEPKDGWTRRRWVKTAVGAGVAGAVVGAGAATLIPLSKEGERVPRFPYIGVKVLPGSKAPRGIPLVPVRTNDQGELVGQPDHLTWYRYCGRNNLPGLDPKFPTDNAFRYQLANQVRDDAKEEGIGFWFEGRVGQVARLEDFDEVGKGASVLWRSEGEETTNPLVCLLVRVDPSTHDAALAERFFPDGILGVFATCAHLCCAPTWRASRIGYGEGHWDDITCHCHGSWYSPRELVEYQFPPTA
jgi:Rieske Fe-S protein